MSVLQTHFEIPVCETLNAEATSSIKAKCKHCSVIIAGRRDVTSNFVTHMKERNFRILENNVFNYSNFNRYRYVSVEM